jgi:sec-independent protein translocase protein TatA
MIGPYTLAWLTDPWTYLLVGLVALLLFGKRLPEVGRSLGRGIAEFKKGLREVQDEVMREEDHEPAKPRLRPPEDESEAEARKRLAREEHPAAVGREDEPPDVH